MSRLGDNSALLVAGLDLSLVQMLRQAIRTADLSSAATSGSGHAIADNSPRQAAARSVTRSVYTVYRDQPAATFEPSTMHLWHPRLAELQPYTCTRPVLPVDAKPFIQPPWKVLPWPAPHRPCLPPGHRMIKVQANTADVSSVGRTLDLFI